MVRQLIYVSSSETRDIAPETECILHVARERNAAVGVTGLLVFAGGSFFQVLEGEHEDVEGVWRRVRRDGRHRGILKLSDGDVESRAFADWSMGWLRLANDDPAACSIRQIAALEDVPVNDGATSKVARTLLESFLKVNAN